MPSGTTTVDFGAFPGASDASAVVSGQTSILGTSLVEAWLLPKDTSDHSADEHLVEPIKVIAGPPSAGVGFTIYAMNTNNLFEPLESPGVSRFRSAATTVYGGIYASSGGQGTLLYGQWTVAWVWV